MKYIDNELQNERTERANFNISSNNLVDVMDSEPWKKSSTDVFTIKYNGELVESNEMDANELATSLSGISSVLENANAIINGEYSKIFVKVHGSFKAGSFEVDIATFFTSDQMDAIVNIIALVGFTTGITARDTLIWLFRQTKGKKILKKNQIKENTYEIIIEDNQNPIIVNGDLIILSENSQVRRGLANIVYPLNNEGMSDITFLKNGVECEKILRDEREYFPLLDTETIEKKESIDLFLIIQANFEGKQTGWRLSFGQSTEKKTDDFPVTILDKNFLKKVRERETKISNEGTIIKAKYRKTTRKLERLNVTWEILEVLEVDSTPHKLLDKKQKTL